MSLHHRKSDPIKITHYVNPHEFWFKYENDDLFEREYIREIDRKIKHLRNDTKNNSKYSPAIGDIVILRYCFGAIDKLIRARVDCEHKYNKYKHGSDFILWAMDEGYPILSNKKWVIKLESEDLQHENPFIFKGTVNQVVPATTQFNMLESASEMVKTKCWSERAVDEVEKIISDATSLIFHYDSHAAKQHLFGSVEIITYSGTSISLNDVVKGLHEALDCSTNFEQEYLRLTQKDYWDQQQSSYKIKQNGLLSIPQQDIKIISKKVIPSKNIVDKMKDWDQRNNSFLSMEKEKAAHLTLPMTPMHRPMQTCTVEVHEKNSTSQSSNPSSNVLSNFERTSNFDFVKVRDMQTQNVLMHCTEGIFVNEITKIEESNFTQEVQDELKSKGFKKPLFAQPVAWPLLMRTHSLTLINSTRRGKTWTYLPAVCSLISESHSDKRIIKGDGPVMIIICMNSLDVDKVVKHCRNLLKKSQHNVTLEAAYGERHNKSIQDKLVEGIDILVTTIPCLLRLMAGPLKFFNKKRMTTIVFDGIDEMCNRYGEQDVELIYNTFCIQTNRIQVIVTSTTWNKILEKFCQKKGVLLCIGAPIEAAIYSNIEITLQIGGRENQYNKFLECFKTKEYAYQQTIVICNTDKEIIEINEVLCSVGITMSTKRQEISRFIAQDQFTELGVVVCTDDTLPDLNIGHAQNIIHYSLPSDWNKFTKRFLASVDYYENLVEDGFPHGQPTTVVFMNENSDLFSRIIDFMKTRCFAEIPEEILQLAGKKQIEQEFNSLSKYKYTPVCNNLFIFGVCSRQFTCSSRHIFTKSDRSRENIPRNGDIKFEIITIHTPTHYTVRMLEHRPLKETKWQKIPYADDYFSFQSRLKNYFNKAENRLLHHPPKLSDLCGIRYKDKFKRCKIVGIDSTKTEVTVLLIDSNETTHCRNKELLVLPEQMKKFPHHVVDIRISGIVPTDLDSNWESKSTQILKKWFDVSKDFHIQGRIEFTFIDCIWLNSIELIQVLPSITEEVMTLSVKDQIIKQKIGAADMKPLVLRKMAEIVENQHAD